MRSTFVAILCALFILSLVTCSKKSETEGGGGEVHLARAIITSEGGTISANGIELTFPPGSLPSSLEISVNMTNDAPTGYVGLSPLFHFGPDGTTFTAPVKVSIALTSENPNVQLFWSNGSGGYEPIAATVVDGVLVGYVTHFSEGFAGATSTPTPTASPSPNSLADCNCKAPSSEYSGSGINGDCKARFCIANGGPLGQCGATLDFNGLWTPIATIACPTPTPTPTPACTCVVGQTRYSGSGINGDCRISSCLASGVREACAADSNYGGNWTPETIIPCPSPEATSTSSPSPTTSSTPAPTSTTTPTRTPTPTPTTTWAPRCECTAGDSDYMGNLNGGMNCGVRHCIVNGSSCRPDGSNAGTWSDFEQIPCPTSTPTPTTTWAPRCECTAGDSDYMGNLNGGMNCGVRHCIVNGSSCRPDGSNAGTWSDFEQIPCPTSTPSPTTTQSPEPTASSTPPPTSTYTPMPSPS